MLRFPPAERRWCFGKGSDIFNFCRGKCSRGLHKQMVGQKEISSNNLIKNPRKGLRGFLLFWKISCDISSNLSIYDDLLKVNKNQIMEIFLLVGTWFGWECWRSRRPYLFANFVVGKWNMLARFCRNVGNDVFGFDRRVCFRLFWSHDHMKLRGGIIKLPIAEWKIKDYGKAD